MKKLIMRGVATVVVTALCVGVTAAAYPVPSYKQNAQGTQVVMTVNGDNVFANEYATYMISSKMNFESSLSSFGLDPSTMWDDPEFLNSLRTSTESSIKQYHVVLQKFHENGLKLTRADAREIREYKENLIKQFGGREAFEAALNSQGLSEEMYDNSLVISSCARALNDYYFGEHGVLVPSDEEMSKYYNENYLQAKHVLISTQGLEGEELAAKKKLAEEALKKAQDGEDFDALIKEYGEDPGMSGSPDGYIFKEGDMVDPFYQGAKALGEDEISGLVESDFGYHIIKRMPLDPEQMSTYRDQMIGAVSGQDFNSLVQEWMDAAEVTTVDAELDKITLDNLYEMANPDAPKDDAAADDNQTPAEG